MELQITVASIDFADDARGRRIATVAFEIKQAGRDAVRLPVQVTIADDVHEAEVVKYARDVLHDLTSRLARQTEGWAISERPQS